MLHLRSLSFVVVFYVNTALLVVIGSPMLIFGRRASQVVLLMHAKTTFWWMRILCGTRIEVRGHENIPDSAALVASKHQSAWDTIGLPMLLPDAAMIMKSELMLIPFYGWFSRRLEMIPVKREMGGAAMRQMMRDAKKCAAKQRQVVIFPEGTRRSPGAPPDYKPGVFMLYSGLNLPCVPVALNSGMFWPRRSFIRHSGTLIVEFLEPIPPGLPRKVFMALLEQRIEAASARLLPSGYVYDELCTDPGGDRATEVR
jgi:1-acyl-sn-glycerol-3-phosphate acyltransferase